MNRDPSRLLLVALLAPALAAQSHANPPPFLMELAARSPHDALLPFDTPYPLGGLVYTDRDDTQFFTRQGATSLSSLDDFGPADVRGLGWVVSGARRVLEVTRGVDTPGFFVESTGGVSVSFWVRFRPQLDAPANGFPANTPLLGLLSRDEATSAPTRGLLLEVVAGKLTVRPDGADGPAFSAALAAHDLRRDGQWRHIALTVQALCQDACHERREDLDDAPVILRAYVDGALAIAADAMALSGLDQVFFGSLIDGFEASPAASPFLLDAVFVYDRALSPAELRRLRELEAEGLVRQWPLGAPFESPAVYPHTFSFIRRLDALQAHFPSTLLRATTSLELGEVEANPSTALVWLDPNANVVADLSPIRLTVSSAEDAAPARSVSAVLSFEGVEIRVAHECNGELQQVATLPREWHLYGLVRRENGAVILYVDGVAYPFRCALQAESVAYALHNGATFDMGVAWAATYRGAMNPDAQLARGAARPVRLDRPHERRWAPARLLGPARSRLGPRVAATRAGPVQDPPEPTDRGAGHRHPHRFERSARQGPRVHRAQRGGAARPVHAVHELHADAPLERQLDDHLARPARRRDRPPPRLGCGGRRRLWANALLQHRRDCG